MKVYKLERIQKIPVSLDEAWQFFSRPENLRKITPKEMGFVIKSDVKDIEMFSGMLIVYTVKPVLGIPMTWVTEIKNIKDKEHFIDEQRFGPYSLWHHQHKFKAIEGGVEMTDVVQYVLPLGIIGQIMNTLFIKNKLKQIFDYRVKVVEELFGKM
ncbi:MAG: SRPBCC family protein [Saprospiraceae bacterium]|jgi:ligand-binding SRPBCC domain-containing protein|nr:SRPBCC family protein [Saprospiraceae bacterium]